MIRPADIVAAFGQRTTALALIAKERRLNAKEAELDARADDLNDWSNAVMARNEAAAHSQRIADEGHDANAEWEKRLADMQRVITRHVHPSTQPPATDPQENQ